MTRVAVAFTILFCAASPAWAAVSHVQTSKTIDIDGNATVTTASMTFSSGSLAICTVLSYDGGLPTIAATLDGGSSFAVDRTATDSSTMRVTFLSMPNVSSGGHTCNVTASAAVAYFTVFLTEVSGAVTSAPQDGAGASANGSSSASASGAFTTVATSFVVAATISGTGANPATFTAGSGWTIPTNGSETNGSVNVTGAVEYKANPGTTSHNGQMTVSNADWVAVGFAYLAAAGGAPTSAGMLLRGVAH